VIKSVRHLKYGGTLHLREINGDHGGHKEVLNEGVNDEALHGLHNNHNLVGSIMVGYV